MNVRPSQKYALGAILMLLALVVMYPLTVGPLALLHGAGMLDDKAIDAIRPIYAPLKPLVTKTQPAACWSATRCSATRWAAACISRFRLPGGTLFCGSNPDSARPVRPHPDTATTGRPTCGK